MFLVIFCKIEGEGEIFIMVFCIERVDFNGIVFGKENVVVVVVLDMFLFIFEQFFGQLDRLVWKGFLDDSRLQGRFNLI